ncbi:Coenzyme PQQ synthesis protein D [Calidithermus terrae]|nr:PqqD family protein [Calidithermus terrae]RIH90703.1 Coenzyme PQQ synthesis protein D [Calidithermus terrae]
MEHTLDLLRQRPTLIEHAVINEDESGAITVLNPVTGKVFVINDVGRRVLELSDGNRSLEQIIVAVCEEFAQADPDLVRRDVQDFVAGCLAAQLLQA